MKPTAATVIQRQGSLGGKKVQMGFDPENVAHLMGLLANLYSDLELAIIREYSNNARDAHIEAGQGRPIEVTLPSANGWGGNYFKVKDFGTGMSSNQLENVFSKFGTSTKRDSNDVTGMMGIGAKCAMAYTPQFTVTSIQDGRKTVVAISKDESGVGIMEIVDEFDTEEPNGVEVSVPAKPGHNFAHKSAEFFKFWKPGTVLVNGKEPAHIEGEQITPEIMTVSEYGDDLIVMGDIAYPVEQGLYTGNRGYGYGGQFRVICTVPIGSVSITPSREGLLYDAPNTQATIKALQTEVTRALKDVVENDVATAPDHGEALNRYIKWNNLYGPTICKGVQYKDEEIPLRWDGEFTTWTPSLDRYSVDTMGYIDHKIIKNSVIITGFPGIKLTPRHKAKMRKWAETAGKSVTRYLLCDENPGLPWVRGEGVVSWQTIKDIKLPTTAGGKPVVTVPVYNASTGRTTQVEIDDLDTKKPIWYTSPKEKMAGRRLAALVGMLGDGTMVVIGENRWDKFKRDCPKAVRPWDAIHKVEKGAVDALTADDYVSLAMGSSYGVSLLKSLDPSKIDDPEIVRYIGLAKGLTTSPSLVHYNKVLVLSTNLGRQYEIRQYLKQTNGSFHPFKNYPLLDGYSPSGNVKHATIYINAAYKAATQNGV